MFWLMAGVVVAEGLWKRYRGGGVALRDVSLVVEEGSVVALLGPNGSGKSTFMRIAAGVLWPTRGRLLVLGEEPYRSPGVRGRVSYMPQDAGLYGSLTGYENYMFYAALQGVEGEARGRLEELAGELGLGEWFYERRVASYSGGMRRKASLAVALASDPEVLLLDEPTAGLDPASRVSFWRVVEGLRRSGRTVVMATHFFDEAEYLADRVVVMHGGRVVAEGEPGALKEGAGYRYAVDVELAVDPGEVVGRLDMPGVEVVPGRGFGLTVLGNSGGLLEEVEERLGGVAVSVSMRPLSLGDVYFLLTGVRLG